MHVPTPEEKTKSAEGERFVRVRLIPTYMWQSFDGSDRNVDQVRSATLGNSAELESESETQQKLPLGKLRQAPSLETASGHADARQFSAIWGRFLGCRMCGVHPGKPLLNSLHLAFLNLSQLTVSPFHSFEDS